MEENLTRGMLRKFHPDQTEFCFGSFVLNKHSCTLKICCSQIFPQFPRVLVCCNSWFHLFFSSVQDSLSYIEDVHHGVSTRGEA